MATTTQPILTAAPALATQQGARWPILHLATILTLWLIVFAAALTTPPLLDDADATHAQAAQAMLRTGDLVTLHVDGIRYLEKAPLPYWIAALSLRLFGDTAFAIHLPLALTVLGLALLGYIWSRRAFGERAAFFTAIFTLTATGVFLFTRIFIPDALLSLLLAFTLYAFLRSIDPATDRVPRAFRLWSHKLPRREGALAPEDRRLFPYFMWLSLALAVLTKGLVTLIFFFGTAIIYLLWTRQLHLLHRLKPFTGPVLFLAVAAPWHILAGLRNTAGASGHGFFWFYFVNEHFLRFLGRRIPRDYNKLPTALYWSLHLVWLFPWSLFAPAAILIGLRKRRQMQDQRDHHPSGEPLSRLELLRRHSTGSVFTTSFATQTVLLLGIFSALVMAFFSLSTNQEYYTFPVYLPLLMLLAAALATNHAPRAFSPATARVPRSFSFGSHNPEEKDKALALAFAALTLIGLAIALTLSYGLWTARHLPFTPDIGSALAHRGIGDYTLSMSHFFDLTGPSFAALRLPATLAALAFAVGPAIAWLLYARHKLQLAILTIAATSAVFLIAAHIALVRFTPLLSSASFAQTIQRLEATNAISTDNQVLIYGDQAFGSSIPFYLHRQVLLVDGRSTSMLFGSTFPDAPPIFLTPQQLAAQWGTGPRKLLFVPLEERKTADHLLGSHTILLQETSGKALLTDRPLH